MLSGERVTRSRKSLTEARRKEQLPPSVNSSQGWLLSISAGCRLGSPSETSGHFIVGWTTCRCWCPKISTQQVRGYGLAGDAYHVAAPTEDGDGPKRAMLAAIGKWMKTNEEEVVTFVVCCTYYIQQTNGLFLFVRCPGSLRTVGAAGGGDRIC